MSIERRKMLALLGAELVLTEAAKGMKGAIAKAEELQGRHARRHHPAAVRQSGQSRRSTARTTAEEIWNDTDGKIDFFVSGVGTGGTLTGVGGVLTDSAGRRRDHGRRLHDRRAQPP